MAGLATNFTSSGGAGGSGTLDSLINELLSGSNSSIANQEATRAQALQTLMAQMGAFGKDSALADAQGAMQAQLAEALKQLMPTITRAAEGAGTSANSMRALLTQDAASQAAAKAALLGLDNLQAYGQIQAGYAPSIANMTQIDTSALDVITRLLQLQQASSASGGSTGSGGGRSVSSGGSYSPWSQYYAQSNAQSSEYDKWVAQNRLRDNQGMVSGGPLYTDSQYFNSLSSDTLNALVGQNSYSQTFNENWGDYGTF